MLSWQVFEQEPHIVRFKGGGGVSTHIPYGAVPGDGGARFVTVANR